MSAPLSALRRLLFRASRVLETRDEPSAKSLLKQIVETLDDVSSAEAGLIRGDSRIAAVVASGQALLARTRLFASDRGFTVDLHDSVPPRRDTTPTLSRIEIRKAIDAMSAGALEPPQSLRDELAADQLVDPDQTLPPADITLPALPDDPDGDPE